MSQNEQMQIQGQECQKCKPHKPCRDCRKRQYEEDQARKKQEENK